MGEDVRVWVFAGLLDEDMVDRDVVICRCVKDWRKAEAKSQEYTKPFS